MVAQICAERSAVDFKQLDFRGGARVEDGGLAIFVVLKSLKADERAREAEAALAQMTLQKEKDV